MSFTESILGGILHEASLVGQLVLLLSQASFEGSLLRVLMMFQVGLGVSLVLELNKHEHRSQAVRTG